MMRSDATYHLWQWQCEQGRTYRRRDQAHTPPSHNLRDKQDGDFQAQQSGHVWSVPDLTDGDGSGGGGACEFCFILYWDARGEER